MNTIQQALITLFTIICLASAQTQFSGHISENTTWDSDMLITGDVWVDDLATLSIQNGVTVYFVRLDSNQDGIGDTDFIVNGQLVTTGVTFTSYETSPQNTDWGGIDYLTASDGQNSTLYNTQIFYAYEGVYIDGHFMTLNNLEIAGSNQYGLHIQNSSSTTSLTNVNLVDNGTYGMEIVNGDVSINGGLIFGNSSYGLKAHSGANVDINGLISSSNGSYGLWLTGGNSNTTINTVQSVSNTGYGLFIENKDNAEINNSSFSDNLAEGVYIEESSNNILFDYCEIRANAKSVSVIESSVVTITNSNIIANGSLINIEGDSSFTMNYCNIESNYNGYTQKGQGDDELNLYMSGCTGSGRESQSAAYYHGIDCSSNQVSSHAVVRRGLSSCSSQDDWNFQIRNQHGTDQWNVSSASSNIYEAFIVDIGCHDGYYTRQWHDYHNYVLWDVVLLFKHPEVISALLNLNYSTQLDAQYNWWGTVSGIDNLIIQAASGNVNYDDFATSFISGNGATFVNLEPEFTFTAPTTTADDPESITFQWIDMDVDDNATISIYYTDGTTSGTIVSGISEDDDSNDSYTWNLDGVPYGIYTVYAEIDDGSNDVVSVTLDVPVMVGPLSIIVPSDLSAPAGATFTVPIELVNPLEEDNILSFSFSLGYDFTLITALEASSAGTLTDGWAITYDINLGQLFVSGYTIDAPLTDRGVLINLMFLANENANNLTIANLNIFDAYLNDAAVEELIDGSFQVVNEFELSGRLKYYNSENSNGMPGATIGLTNESDELFEQTTDNDGYFTFSNMPTTNYSVNVSHDVGVCNETVSMYDASLVAQFHAQMIGFDADQMVASDVNGENGVTVYDAALIAQYVVQNTDSFDSGSWNIPNTGPYYMDEDLLGQEIKAIAIGDPSGNWEPCEDSGRDSEQLLATASQGEIITIIFSYDESFQSFQSNLQYDDDKISLHEVYTASELEEFTTLTNNLSGNYIYGGFGLEQIFVEDNVMMIDFICNVDVINEPVEIQAYFDENTGSVTIDVSQTVMGDLNGDDTLNVLDIVLLINYILNVIELDDTETADINSDGLIDILDVVILIQIVLGDEGLSRQADNVVIQKGLNNLMVESNGDVTFHMTLQHEKDLNLSLSNNSYLAKSNTVGDKTEVIIINPDNGILFTTESDFSIVGIEAANSNGFIDVSITNLPTEFNINSVYPNPFNPVTNISFDIAKSGYYKLIIMDIQGSIIETIGNGYLDPGRYENSWDAGRFASGVYFVQLQFDNQLMSTNKLMLVK